MEKIWFLLAMKENHSQNGDVWTSSVVMELVGKVKPSHNQFPRGKSQKLGRSSALSTDSIGISLGLCYTICGGRD